MFHNTLNWYTDNFDVYRTTQITERGVIKDSTILISQDNIGRVYMKKTSPINMTNQSGEVSQYYTLACSNEIDIKPGDQIKVKRGYSINQYNGQEELFIAGMPTKYMTPFGGRNVDLSHQEISIQYIKRPDGVVKDENINQ